MCGAISFDSQKPKLPLPFFAARAQIPQPQEANRAFPTFRVRFERAETMRKPVRDVQLLAPIGGQRVGRPSTVGRRADTVVYCNVMDAAA